MQKIYQAKKNDGTFKLIAPSSIAGIAREAKAYGRRNTTHAFARLLSHYCYLNQFAEIVEIAYDTNGTQKRVPVIQQVCR